MLYGATPFYADSLVATYANIMNFQKTLKFDQDEIEISEEAESLIRG